MLWRVGQPSRHTTNRFKHMASPSTVRWSSAVDSTIELACTGLAHRAREQPSLASVGGAGQGAGAASRTLERPTLRSVRFFCTKCIVNVQMTHTTSQKQPRVCACHPRAVRLRGHTALPHIRDPDPEFSPDASACAPAQPQLASRSAGEGEGARQMQPHTLLARTYLGLRTSRARCCFWCSHGYARPSSLSAGLSSDLL